jgi:hypothetical protein
MSSTPARHISIEQIVAAVLLLSLLFVGSGAGGGVNVSPNPPRDVKAFCHESAAVVCTPPRRPA